MICKAQESDIPDRPLPTAVPHSDIPDRPLTTAVPHNMSSKSYTTPDFIVNKQVGGVVRAALVSQTKMKWDMPE